MPTALSSVEPRASAGRRWVLRLKSFARSATSWHYLSLVIGLVTIVGLQRSQWFFFDEWAFLGLDANIWYPHVGHWSTAPTLIYFALFAVFGLHTYLPYAVVITVIHLVAAHLIWRVARRVEVDPWIATCTVFVFILLGSGSENILWAFQIGYVGALVVGLFAFLVALSPNRSLWRFVVIVGIAVFSLTWSGTSIPLLVATVAVVLWKDGWRRGLILTMIAGCVYLTWFVLNGPGPDTGGVTLYKVFVQMPQFIGVALVMGFGDVFPVAGLGVSVLVGLAIWISLTIRRRRQLPTMMPAFILIGAVSIFLLMSAYSRAGFSVGSGRSSRYVYLIVLLLLPALALALTRALEGRRPLEVVAVCVLLIGLAIGYQGLKLGNDSEQQAILEQRTKRLLSAALYLYETEPSAVNLDAQPDPIWAPDLRLSRLAMFYEQGYISIENYTDQDLKDEKVYILKK